MSGQLTGLILAGANLGYQSLIVKPKRAIGPFDNYVTTEERHSDAMEITDHPIEQGALISDHAYLRPPELVIKAGWSNSQPDPGALPGVLGGLSGLAATPAKFMQSIGLGQSTNQVKDIYDKLLALQASRVPFLVFTGKRLYQNMLIKSLITTTDKSNENILSITITLRAVTLVSTRLLTAAPDTAQKDPGATGGVSLAGNRALIPAAKINVPAANSSIKP